MEKPFLPLVAALVAGITAGSLYHLPDLPVQIGLALALALIFLFRKLKRNLLLQALFLVCLFFIGVLDINLQLHPIVGRNHILNHVSNDLVCAEGIIFDNPQVSPDKSELIIAVSRIVQNGAYLPVSGRVLLTIRSSYPFRYGDYIRFHARLRIPRNFKNPGHFDYEKYLRFRGILVQGFIKDEAGFVVLRSGRGNPLRLWLENFRDLIRNSITARVAGTEGAIIRAMILGDQKAIPKEVMENFNRTGTSHIIAISGFNIGIVAAFALFLAHLCLKREYLLLKWNVLRLSLIVSIAVVVFYTFVAGAAISVIRASVMVSVFMGALLLNREGDLYNTFFLAAFVILIIAPHSLFDISFQLSFTAVLALIFFMPKWLALIPARNPSVSTNPTKQWVLHLIHKALRSLVLFLLASLSATLGTLPLILFYFNRLSLITLAANFLLVPILGILAVPVSLAIILAVPVSATLTDWVIRISELLVKLSLSLVERLAALPWASIYVSTPTLLEIGSFYLLLIWFGLFLKWLEIRIKSEKASEMSMLMKAVPIALLLFFLIDGIYLHAKNSRQGHLCMTAVDVGQGNSILIRFPGGRKMLVDGGGFYDDSFDLGKYVLAPYLWHERITRIDTVVLSHPHPDHLQGLLFILDNFHVREVWSNGETSDTELYDSFRQLLLKKRLILRTLSDRTPPLDFFGVGIKVLNPEGKISARRPPPSPAIPLSQGHPSPSLKSYAATSDATNDRSLVLKLHYGDIHFLLPGDITTSVESRLIREEADLKSDVVIVPHHGSFRSSGTSFIERVNPRTAIVSCGSGNVFGFPHADILRRYEMAHASVYRTDRNGAITVCTDGRTTVVDLFDRGDR